MKIQLPEKVKFIISELKKNGFEAYAVGGCVRDSILGREPNDWDITTSARPLQVKGIFGHTIDTGIQHGTVTVMLEHEGFEVTTYRIDGEYEDARHPKNVSFTSNLLEDLKRRDFTINAMAYNDEDGLVDAFDGIGDMQRKVIRCVGKAQERFEEDALRMLRAVRFAAMLGFAIDEGTRKAIEELAPNLSRISAERIQTELVKLVSSPHPEEMRTVYETGIADVILPEFSVAMVTPQNTPHHMYTVGEHIIHAMMGIRADRILRLTMLLHDLGKPACRTTDEDGIDHFKGHPEKGAEMAKVILRRLKFDNDTIDRVTALVRWHDDRPHLDEKSIRRAIYRCGEDHFPDLFEVQLADISAQSTYRQEEKIQSVHRYEEIYRHICEEKQCLSLKHLAVTGQDLIAEGMQPGRRIGEVLKAMLEDVLDHPGHNTREYLLRAFYEDIKK